MALKPTLTFLKAAADHTRLRLLVLLNRGEATVGELVDVLGQSQPRVSRHLKILTQAQLVTHFRDGQWVYYRLDPAGASASVLAAIVNLCRSQDEIIAGDEARMAAIRQRRERYALAAASGPARLAAASAERPDEELLRQALEDELGTGSLGDILDIGVGSGAVLRLLAPRTRSAVGLDTARGMRVLARSRLQREEDCSRCTIRAGDMHALPFPELSFDLVVMDEVLAQTAHPQLALSEALRVLRPAGRLLVLDRILPAALRLPPRTSDPVLFENQLGVMLRELGLKSARPVWFPGRTLKYALVSATAASRRRTGTDG